MSWNEPGGNKKDPWSGRDQQETPPDLEEVMRSLREKLGGMFGGGGSDLGGNSKNTLILLIAVPLVIWGLTGIYIVDEGSRGVVTRFGKYMETTQPGPHWRLPAPIESHTIVNVEQQRFIEVGYRSNNRQQASQSFSKEALMLTQDENIVDVRLSVQYQIKDAKNYLFNLSDPDTTLRQVTESAERGVIGKNTMDFVLTEGRSSFADEMKVEIQKILDDYNAGIRVMAVSVKDAQPPEEVQSAFEDAIKAREDEQRLKNEAEAYANEVIPKARGAAARLTEESEGYKLKLIAKAKGEAGRFEQLLTEYLKAPEITRERLYLDTMEAIFDKTNTVLLDVKGGNNMIYLPIDKFQRPGLAAEPAKDGDTAQTYQDSTDSVVKTVRGAVGRGREGRTQ
ncbi:MAG: FtsH protease activity modulator HflK [Proteobacteria bacterium]|nr:FtsH protease activity modulator HflK [Pseudomonadota bacterium]